MNSTVVCQKYRIKLDRFCIIAMECHCQICNDIKYSSKAPILMVMLKDVIYILLQYHVYTLDYYISLLYCHSTILTLNKIRNNRRQHRQIVQFD